MNEVVFSYLRHRRLYAIRPALSLLLLRLESEARHICIIRLDRSQINIDAGALHCCSRNDHEHCAYISVPRLVLQNFAIQ